MRKSAVFIVLLVLCAISVSAAGSEWDQFKNYYKKNIVTGNAVATGGLTATAVWATCSDEDGTEASIKGQVKDYSSNTSNPKSYTDTCRQNSKDVTECSGNNCSVKEYSCNTTTTIGSKEILCPKGCKDGACLKDSICKDTDGSRDFTGVAIQTPISEKTYPSLFVKGSINFINAQTTSAGMSSQDSCNSAGYLIESFCSTGNSSGSLTVKCPNGCKDGACIKAVNATPTAAVPTKTSTAVTNITCTFLKNKLREQTCTFKAGTTTASCSGVTKCSTLLKGVEGTLIEPSSTCGSTTKKNTLGKNKEFYISNKSRAFVFTCPEVCDDADGGLNYSLKARTALGSTLKIDVCSSSSKLTEYYCGTVFSGGSVRSFFRRSNPVSSVPKILSSVTTCPNGCRNGTCIDKPTAPDVKIPEAKCVDSDGGLNYGVKGNTYGTAKDGIRWNKTDYCNGNTIMEYNCNGTLPGNGGSYSCPNGCKDGACINTPSTTTTYEVGPNTDGSWPACNKGDTIVKYKTVANTCAGYGSSYDGEDNENCQGCTTSSHVLSATDKTIETCQAEKEVSDTSVYKYGRSCTAGATCYAKTYVTCAKTDGTGTGSVTASW